MAQEIPSSAMSFWEANQETPTLNPPLTESTTVDVAVIGGGFTGLTAAREIRLDEPSSSVAVLEAQFVGFGASGRNGGFNMTLFGLEPEVTIMRWGTERARAAHAYMVRAVHYVRDLVERHGLESDYQHTGLLRVAYSGAQLKRLEKSLHLFDKLGAADQYAFLTEAQVQTEVRSARFKGAVFEANSGILDPFKHVRNLKSMAEQAGVQVYEGTPVEKVVRDGDVITLNTPKGSLRCRKLVIAVNAWSGFVAGLPRIRSRQVPVWTSQVVTQPLSAAQWDEIGWHNRQSIEDNRQLIHYFRRTVCGRITMGGGNAHLGRGREMGQRDVRKTWQDLARHLKWLFPVLRDVGVDYRWGGPVSVNVDMSPEIGFIGDDRVVYANGCIGHGVSLTQLNGRTIADLVLEKRTDLTDFWIVNRKAIRWPPGWLGTATFYTILGGLKLWDKVEERGLEG